MAAVAGVVLAGCASGASVAPAPTTPSPTTPSPTTPGTAVASSVATPTTGATTTSGESGPGTTVAATAITEVPDTGLASVPVNATCTFTAAQAGSGSITFAKAGKLFELVPGARAAACVAPLGDQPAAAVTWSPDGTRALVGGVKVVASNAVRPSGFDPGDGSVSWSYPTGKALIAPSTATGALTWRNSADPTQTRDVSFLAHTDVAVYHLAGKDIIAAGTAKDGVRGLFIASNRGENVRTLATLNEPTTKITEIAVSPDNFVYFVHDHGTYQELHSLQLPGLMLTNLARGEQGETLSHLTVGTAGAAVAVGDCSATMRVWSNTLADGRQVLPGRSVMPVGWLGTNLVVEARTQGCSGPADVWLVDTLDSGTSATRLLQAVDEVSVRTVLANYQEVPGDINAQAPG